MGLLSGANCGDMRLGGTEDAHVQNFEDKCSTILVSRYCSFQPNGACHSLLYIGMHEDLIKFNNKKLPMEAKCMASYSRAYCNYNELEASDGCNMIWII